MAAASSIASGRPSSRLQISPTAAPLPGPARSRRGSPAHARRRAARRAGGQLVDARHRQWAAAAARRGARARPGSGAGRGSSPARAPSGRPRRRPRSRAPRRRRARSCRGRAGAPCRRGASTRLSTQAAPGGLLHAQHVRDRGCTSAASASGVRPTRKTPSLNGSSRPPPRAARDGSCRNLPARSA